MSDVGNMNAEDVVKVGRDLLYAKVKRLGRLDAHGDPCKRALAELCAVGIECEHAREVCDECDPCSCGMCP